MPNRNGQAFGLTVLSPILSGTADGKSHAAAIRQTLAAFPADAFARAPKTHVARWVVIDDAPFEEAPALEDHLAVPYLLFTSDFDGDLDPYLIQLSTAMSEPFTAIYQHCVGFPGTDDVEAFIHYMKRCQVNTTFNFGAYPNATVEDVLRAVASQRALVEFVDAHQHISAAELQSAFREFLDRIERTPLPLPGSA